MTQEDKELLFKDLCARLPYHVRVKVWLKDGITEEGPLDLEHNYGDVLQDAFYFGKIVDIKPYLRPMSSMTRDEIKAMLSKSQYKDRYTNDGMDCIYQHIIANEYAGVITINSIETFVIDWLNSHYFDYRKLIEKGLALVAPKDMYA